MRLRLLALARSRADIGLAAALAAAAQLEIWTNGPVEHRLAYATLAIAGTGIIAVRRRAPFVVLLVVVLAFGGASTIAAPSQEDSIALALALAVALYSAGAYLGGRSAIVGGVAAVSIALIAVATDPEPAKPEDVVFFLALLTSPWIAGRAIRRRSRREAELVVERDERARLAVAEEQERIARELHDVVAHAISVVVLQARGARHALESDVDEAREALAAIETTASAALTEMRRLLGLLRRDDAALAPQPGLAQLDALAMTVRAAGLPVEVRVEGEGRELAPGVDLSAYRIVQEALTNALKHAGHAQARVLVRYEPEHVELEVSDDGAGAGVADAPGHGLVGMRERAAIVGGEIEAGPRAGGGFLVRARLPRAT